MFRLKKYRSIISCALSAALLSACLAGCGSKPPAKSEPVTELYSARNAYGQAVVVNQYGQTEADYYVGPSSGDIISQSGQKVVIPSSSVKPFAYVDTVAMLSGGSALKLDSYTAVPEQTDEDGNITAAAVLRPIGQSMKFTFSPIPRNATCSYLIYSVSSKPEGIAELYPVSYDGVTLLKNGSFMADSSSGTQVVLNASGAGDAVISISSIDLNCSVSFPVHISVTGMDVAELFEDEPAEETDPEVPAPVITKDPLGEKVLKGEGAEFVARADGAEHYEWYFLDQDENIMPLSDYRVAFPDLIVDGADTERLILQKVPMAMDGWSVLCRFSNEGGTATSAKAVIDVYKEKEDPAHTHTLNSGVINREVSCTAYGIKIHTCKICGEKKAVILPATGHSFYGGKCTVCKTPQPHVHSYLSNVTARMTCTSDGVRTYRCGCGYTYTEAIPSPGHIFMDGFCIYCGEEEPAEPAETPAS